jgi:hypothetical protein
MFGLFKKKSEDELIRQNVLDYVECRIESLMKEYENNKESKFKQLFKRKSNINNPLALKKISVKGFEHAARSSVVSSFSGPIGVAVDTAAGLIIDKTRTEVEKRISSHNSVDGSSESILSYKLITGQSISNKTQNAILNMRHQIQSTILATSEYIENKEFQSLSELLDHDVSEPKKVQISQFIDGHYKMHVSYHSMAISLKLFAKINERLLDKIEMHREGSGSDYHSLAVVNAVLIYEVSDVIIGFLKDFEVQGVDEILCIYQQVDREIERGKEQNNDIIEQINNQNDDSSIEMSRSIERAQDRIKALQELDKQWKLLLDKIKGIQGEVSKFKSCISRLEIMKKEAAANITILGLMEVTKMVKSNIETIEGVLEVNDKIEIAPLTAQDVFRFLRVEETKTGLPMI